MTSRTTPISRESLKQGLEKTIDRDKRAQLYKDAAAGKAGATQAAQDLATKEYTDQKQFLTEALKDVWNLNARRKKKVKTANRVSDTPKDPVDYMNVAFTRLQELYDNLSDQNPHNNSGQIKAKVISAQVIPIKAFNSKVSSTTGQILWKAFRRGEGDVCQQNLVEVIADYAPLALAPLPSTANSSNTDLTNERNAKRAAMAPKFYGVMPVGIEPPREGDIISCFYENDELDSGIFVKVLERVEVKKKVSPKGAFEGKGKTQLGQ